MAERAQRNQRDGDGYVPPNLRSVGQRSGSAADGKPRVVRFQKVPILAIFKIESDAMLLPPAELEIIKESYEKCVNDLMDLVAELLKKDGLDDIRKMDERILFEFLSQSFRNYSGVSIVEQPCMVSTAMIDGEFNCYSSAILLADVLTRMGKAVNLLIVPDHALLAGRDYAFETTTDFGGATFPASRLDLEYPKRQETGTGMLLYLSHIWAGAMHASNGRFNEAIDSYGEATVINPEHPEAWSNKAGLLVMAERYDEALELTGRAIAADPEYARAWNNRGVALYMTGRYEEALEAYDRAVKISPEFEEAEENKLDALAMVLKNMQQ